MTNPFTAALHRLAEALEPALDFGVRHYWWFMAAAAAWIAALAIYTT